jgi:murein DD-endopeptidase MepM/ murein hydrolase activator NlpD
LFSETIPLDSSNTELLTKPDPKKTAEAERLWKMLLRTNPHFLANTPFMQPVTTERRTSGFGDRRTYVYADGKREKRVHGGIDFGVKMGTEVHACADGLVTLAEFRIVTGNSIAIEHWPGLYSLYYHLDSLKVKVGDPVRQGEVIGLSGSTGLSTGPHLHWEIRLHGQSTDPDIFTTQSVLDKDRRIGKIYEAFSKLREF